MGDDRVKPDEFDAAIASLGLTQVAAAELFGANGRTARRWVLGESEIPELVEATLRIMVRRKIPVEDFHAIVDGRDGRKDIRSVLLLLKKHKISPIEAVRLIERPLLPHEIHEMLRTP